jgi:hypothetical protein
MCLPMTVQRSFADRSHMRRRRINVSTYDGERSFADRRGRCGGADKSASKKAMTEYTTVALFFFFAAAEGGIGFRNPSGPNAMLKRRIFHGWICKI